VSGEGAVQMRASAHRWRSKETLLKTASCAHHDTLSPFYVLMPSMSHLTCSQLICLTSCKRALLHQELTCCVMCMIVYDEASSRQPIRQIHVYDSLYHTYTSYTYSFRASLHVNHTPEFTLIVTADGCVYGCGRCDEVRRPLFSHSSTRGFYVMKKGLEVMQRSKTDADARHTQDRPKTDARQVPSCLHVIRGINRQKRRALDEA